MRQKYAYLSARKLPRYERMPKKFGIKEGDTGIGRQTFCLALYRKAKSNQQVRAWTVLQLC